MICKYCDGEMEEFDLTFVCECGHEEVKEMGYDWD